MQSESNLLIITLYQINMYHFRSSIFCPTLVLDVSTFIFSKYIFIMTKSFFSIPLHITYRRIHLKWMKAKKMVDEHAFGVYQTISKKLCHKRKYISYHLELIKTKTKNIRYNWSKINYVTKWENIIWTVKLDFLQSKKGKKS